MFEAVDTREMEQGICHARAIRMATNHDRERTGPTDEVGSEGGTPGDIDLNKKHVITGGSESTSTIGPTATEIEERDRNKTRDDRPEP